MMGIIQLSFDFGSSLVLVSFGGATCVRLLNIKIKQQKKVETQETLKIMVPKKRGVDTCRGLAVGVRRWVEPYSAYPQGVEESPLPSPVGFRRRLLREKHIIFQIVKYRDKNVRQLGYIHRWKSIPCLDT